MMEFIHVNWKNGILRNKYPFDIFGISDQYWTLHLIAIMITSFETSYDFKENDLIVYSINGDLDKIRACVKRLNIKGVI